MVPSKLVLDCNRGNFFGETEEAAYCTSHVVHADAEGLRDLNQQQCGAQMLWALQ